MSRTLYFALPLILLPTLAAAQSAGDRAPGGGSDIYKVMREVEGMQRDGRWNSLVAEGQANRQAFETARQTEQEPAVTATGSTRPRRAR